MTIGSEINIKSHENRLRLNSFMQHNAGDCKGKSSGWFGPAGCAGTGFVMRAIAPPQVVSLLYANFRNAIISYIDRYCKSCCLLPSQHLPGRGLILSPCSFLVLLLRQTQIMASLHRQQPCRACKH